MFVKGVVGCHEEFSLLVLSLAVMATHISSLVIIPEIPSDALELCYINLPLCTPSSAFLCRCQAFKPVIQPWFLCLD